MPSFAPAGSGAILMFPLAKKLKVSFLVTPAAIASAIHGVFDTLKAA